MIKLLDKDAKTKEEKAKILAKENELQGDQKEVRNIIFFFHEKLITSVSIVPIWDENVFQETETQSYVLRKHFFE